MTSSPHVVSDACVNGHVDLGHNVIYQAVESVEAIDRAGSHCRQELTAWVGPKILCCTGDIRPGGGQSTR